MDEQRFKTLMLRTRTLRSDYGADYISGLRRHYYGEMFGDPAEHAAKARMGLDGDHRAELGRGYRDGLAGKDPDPPVGRPAIAAGEQSTTLTFRLSAAQRAKLDGLGGADWLRKQIDAA